MRILEPITAEYGIADHRVPCIIDATRFGFVDQMVTSGLFKTALSASLLLHAAGIGAIVYFKRPAVLAAGEVIVQRPVLIVTAAAEEAVEAESISVTSSPEA